MVFQDGFKDKEGRVWLVGRDLMGGDANPCNKIQT